MRSGAIAEKASRQHGQLVAAFSTRFDAVLSWDRAAADATAKVKVVLAATVARRGPIGFLYLPDYPFALYLITANKAVTDPKKYIWHCVTGSSVPGADVAVPNPVDFAVQEISRVYNAPCRSVTALDYLFPLYHAFLRALYSTAK